ncbi:hypothetical protein INT45_005753, partial [Circinella minor]
INLLLILIRLNLYYFIPGPLLRVNMGVKRWVIIGDRYLANEMLKVKGSITSGRPYHLFAFDYYALDQRGMTFTNPDVRWKRSRTIAQDVFSAKGVSKIVPTMESEFSRAIDLLFKDTAEKGNVELVKYMQFATLNIILSICFGIRAKSINDPLFQDVIETVDKTVKWGSPGEDIGTFLPIYSKIIDVLSMKPRRNEKRYAEFIYKKRNPLFRRLIQKALERDNTECFVKELYKVKETNQFEEDDILLFLADLCNAGTDTMAMTLSWAFAILCHHEEVQKELRDEIDSFIKSYKRLPTYEEKDNFPFMLSVQKECIRYRPTNHFTIPHESTADFECQGYFIPKGTVLIPNTYTISLDPKSYYEPEKFVPDRYINDLTSFSVSVNASIEKRDQFIFGWGRRLCPGVHLAEVELFNFWVRIFATARIEAPLDNKGRPVLPDLSAHFDAGLVVAPVEPRLRFIERKDRLI